MVRKKRKCFKIWKGFKICRHASYVCRIYTLLCLTHSVCLIIHYVCLVPSICRFSMHTVAPKFQDLHATVLLIYFFISLKIRPWFTAKQRLQSFQIQPLIGCWNSPFSIKDCARNCKSITACRLSKQSSYKYYQFICLWHLV